MTVIGLHHAQITIPIGAEDEARQFYCDLLGLPETAKPDTLAGRGGFWLHVGEIQVHVGTEDGIDRMATKAHLAYEVTDIAVWRERLTAYGVTILESISIPGYDRFELIQPIEVKKSKPNSAR